MELLKLYVVFFKFGLFSFGGGYVLLPLLHQQLEASGLLPIEELTDILAISQMTPGPISINAATYVGFRNHGLIGAFFATLGVITPSIVLTLVAIMIVRRYKDSLIMKSIFDGVKPVTVGMIFVAAIYFLERSVFNGKVLSGDVFSMGLGFVNIFSLLIFIAVFILAAKTRFNPIFLTICAGIIGIIIG